MLLKNLFHVRFVPKVSREGMKVINPLNESNNSSDVLRAHQFRCKERGNLPVPEGQVKGRKRSSCTSCVKLRTKCDQETPCSRCRELGKECVRCKPVETFQGDF